MCDPVSATIVIAGLGASAWAANNQTKSANRNMQAMQTAKEGAFKAGLDRQAGYAGDAGQAFNDSVNKQGAGAYSDQLNDAVGNRLNTFYSAKTPVVQDYSFSASTPGNVSAFQEKAFGEAEDKTNRDNANLAVLSGYTDANFNSGLNRNDYARAFGNLSDTAQRDANLIGLDMNQAESRAFKAPNSTLSMVRMAGQLGSMYGAAGTPGLGGGGAPAPTAQYGANGTPIPVRKPAFGGYAQ